MIKHKYDVAVVGAGIVGLAIAYTAAKKGLKVAVFERSPKAVGASIRNFGLVWPIGQPAGNLFDQAMRSREIWTQIAQESGLWLNQNGSLHLAYHEDEWAVLNDFAKQAQSAGYDTQLLTPQEVPAYANAVQTKGLRGALWSATECTVTSKVAIPHITAYLQAAFGVDFYFGTAITYVEPRFLSDFYEVWESEQIYVCSGAEFEILYPKVFSESGMELCKLQMMRTGPQPDGWQLGASLCAGLTLLHYGSFAHLDSLKAVRSRYQAENPDFSKYGIHVLVAQHSNGEIIIGDSHEYGKDISPFIKDEINRVILDYMSTFLALPDPHISETWYGVYPKLIGKSAFVSEVEPGIWVVNGLGGAGMTMSFGLAADIVK